MVASPQSLPPFRQKWLFLPGFLIAGDERLIRFVPGVVSPVRLHEDGVDLAQIDGFGLIPDGFDESSDAEIFDGSKDAFGGFDNEVEGVLGKGYVG